MLISEHCSPPERTSKLIASLELLVTVDGFPEHCQRLILTLGPSLWLCCHFLPFLLVELLVTGQLWIWVCSSNLHLRKTLACVCKKKDNYAYLV